jgi:hypothetical protein
MGIRYGEKKKNHVRDWQHRVNNFDTHYHCGDIAIGLLDREVISLSTVVARLACKEPISDIKYSTRS